MSDKTLTIRGTVTKIIFSYPTKTVGHLSVTPGQILGPDTITFAGKAYVREGELVTLRGSWVNHKEYGRQFQSDDRVYDEGIDASGLASWLAHHGLAIGIGKLKAKKIAEEYGEGFSAVLQDNPEQVAIQFRLKLDDVRQLAASWKEHQEENSVGTKLVARGLTHAQAIAIYRRFGGGAVSLLESDPYAVLGVIDGLGFKKTDEIARKMGVTDTDPGRLKAAACYVLGETAKDPKKAIKQTKGSTCAERADLIEDTVETLELSRAEAMSLVGNAVEELLAVRGLRQETARDGSRFLALPGHWVSERNVAAFIDEAKGPNPHFPPQTARPEAISLLCPNLDPSQTEAVSLAMTSRACLVTGGAGSGKSTVIAAIAGICRRQGLSVALAAPTGRAARRMEEVTAGKFDASTIHRLLEYIPAQGGFQRNVGNPLDFHVVIVDEASMIDSGLGASLFQAIGTKTALVLVGDPNQLPPVGPGAFLRDAIAHKLLPIAELAQCHRQAGPLKENCAAVLHGVVRPTIIEADKSIGPWAVHRQCHQANDIIAKIGELFTATIRDRFAFDPVRDVQFLSPQHSGPIGTTAINLLLQRLYQKTLGVTVRKVVNEDHPPLYVGDRVIQTRNNYNLGVMNGHQGIVLSVSPLIVQFDGETLAIPDDCRGDVKLAYCLTPHKCQGSEFPCVVTICHKDHSHMLHRNWLYTAVTRAKKVSILLSDGHGLDRAAKRVLTNDRVTLLPVLAGSV